MLHSFVVCLQCKAETTLPLSNHPVVWNKGYPIRIQQFNKEPIVFSLTVMERTRRKTATGGVKLLERESSGRGSINKNALHLLQHCQISRCQTFCWCMQDQPKFIMLSLIFLISCNQSLILWSLFQSYMKLMNYEHGDWCLYLYTQAPSSLLYLSPPPDCCRCLASSTPACLPQSAHTCIRNTCNNSARGVEQNWHHSEMRGDTNGADSLVQKISWIRFLQLRLLDMQGQGVERILMHRS
jgi:hypothetical protein